MGLDSFWKLPEGAQALTITPPLNLCGGLFSGNGEGSFRGKVYADVIEQITGVSIYQEEISNETVRQMADALEDAQKKGRLLFLFEDPTEGNDLVRMFRLYADTGATLHGW